MGLLHLLIFIVVMGKGENKMARYIDADILPKLFDEEYKKTRKLIEDGETHLDNLAEGFSEATRVVTFVALTTDVQDVQEVRHGHWILLRESEITGFNPEFAGRDPIGGYQCSNCKEVAIFDCNDEFVLSRYCPHCGTIMCKDVK